MMNQSRKNVGCFEKLMPGRSRLTMAAAFASVLATADLAVAHQSALANSASQPVEFISLECSCTASDCRPTSKPFQMRLTEDYSRMELEWDDHVYSGVPTVTRFKKDNKIDLFIYPNRLAEISADGKITYNGRWTCVRK